jgi:8-oxo-dGTP pyrophosphatase MutT (NUDIX family)
MKVLNFKEYVTEHIFWGTKAAGILPICTKTGRILVGLRSEDVYEPHTYGIFGGKFDDDSETAEEVAKRELYEETQYDGKIKLIPSYVYTNKNFKYYNFIGLVDKEFKCKLNWENNLVKWITFEELLTLDDKHFGLDSLIENDLETIKRYSKS